jgi:2,3-dihydroxybenzoate-AMP ligase
VPDSRTGSVPWPDEVAQDYVARGYWRGEPLGTLLWRWADAHPDSTAVVDGETRLTYRDLAERADGLAERLGRLGLRNGDNVLVQLPNCWEYVVLTFACFRLGVAPVMALPAHRSHELRYLAAHADVSAVVVPDRIKDFDHEALGHEVAAEVTTARHVLVVGQPERPDSVDLRALAAPADDVAPTRELLDAAAPSSRDVAVFLLSGGTTGLPKLISRTHDDYEYNARRSAEVCGFSAETVYLVAMPAGHNFPLGCPGILGTLQAGGRVVLVRSPEPQTAFAAMRAEGVTVTAAVPAVAQRWMDAVSSGEVEPAPSLQVLQVGGARLAPEVARRVPNELGCRLQQVFGMAEGLLNYTRLDDPDDVVVETQGRPMSEADEIRVVGPDDEPVPDGAMGALLTRGPYTPRGYFRAQEHNARSFTPDGWYRTGDVVRVHPSGNLVVEGRDKDLINRAGEKVSAEEVENLVYRLPGVARVAAVAAPDAAVGERVAVVVVPEGDASFTLDDVRSALKGMGVAAYKLPEHLMVVDELPLTKVGKIDKKRLREVVAGELGSS